MKRASDRPPRVNETLSVGRKSQSGSIPHITFGGHTSGAGTMNDEGEVTTAFTRSRWFTRSSSFDHVALIDSPARSGNGGACPRKTTVSGSASTRAQAESNSVGRDAAVGLQL
ncbi:MAG: hypothetical protein ABTQ32_11140 [Myxococcaceae bacterium]